MNLQGILKLQAPMNEYLHVPAQWLDQLHWTGKLNGSALDMKSLNLFIYKL